MRAFRPAGSPLKTSSDLSCWFRPCQKRLLSAPSSHPVSAARVWKWMIADSCPGELQEVADPGWVLAGMHVQAMRPGSKIWVCVWLDPCADSPSVLFNRKVHNLNQGCPWQTTGW